MHTLRTLLPIWALLPLVGLACGQPGGNAPARASASAATSAARADLVATVNGAPITQLDVRLKLKNDGHKEASRAEAGRPNLDNVLETVIRDELAAQRAAELGLDADLRYRDGLHQLEAQVAAYRRRALSELYWERSVDKSAVPSDADARRYFDQNQKQVRTQVHVKQILRRGVGAMEEIRAQLAGGKKFDDVAAGLFPNRPPGTTPWDLGYLSWYKLPDPWRTVVPALQPGQVSAVIAGPNDRFWILELVDRKEDPDVTFDTVKPAILADLTRARVDEAREKARRELREKARVERLAAPTAGPIVPLEE
jgi:peptidyl-prolyl cis-trans isomerase C